MGLAHWIQGDGFWDRIPGSVGCNETFTEQEGGVAYVELAFPPPCFSSSTNQGQLANPNKQKEDAGASGSAL